MRGSLAHRQYRHAVEHGARRPAVDAKSRAGDSAAGTGTGSHDADDGARSAANAAAGPQAGFRAGCRVGRRRGHGGVSGCVPGQFRAALFGWVGHWCGQRLCHLLSLCRRRGCGRGFSQSRHFAGDGRGRRCRGIRIQSGGVVAGVVFRLSIRWLFFGDCRRSCAGFAGALLCLLSRAQCRGATGGRAFAQGDRPAVGFRAGGGWGGGCLGADVAVDECHAAGDETAFAFLRRYGLGDSVACAGHVRAVFFYRAPDLALGRAPDHVRRHRIARVLHCGQFERCRALSLHDRVGVIGRGVEFSFRRVHFALGDDAPARGKGAGAVLQ